MRVCLISVRFFHCGKCLYPLRFLHTRVAMSSSKCRGRKQGFNGPTSIFCCSKGPTSETFADRPTASAPGALRLFVAEYVPYGP